jgi:hypothetical protein
MILLYILKLNFKRSYLYRINNPTTLQRRIQDFKLGGGTLKKIVPSGGRLENFWGISCEKSRFYAKKSYFFQLRREAWKLLGYFIWKITILCQKIIFFSNFRWGVRRVHPPLDPHLHCITIIDFLHSRCVL